MEGKLINKAIKKWIDSRTYEKGREYFKKAMIYAPFVLENILHAKCKGSSYQEYTLWCEINKNGIINEKCSCPVGNIGKCKHIVALVLEWKNNSENFVDSNNIMLKLNKLSKKKLLTILFGLMKLNYQNVTMIECVLIGSQEFPTMEFKSKYIQIIEKEIPKSGYFSDSEIDPILAFYKDQANFLLNEGKLTKGISLHQAIIDHISEMYSEHLEDIDGEIALLIDECIKAIYANCNEIDDKDFADALMFSLFKAIETDIHKAGVEYAYGAFELIKEFASTNAKKIIITNIQNTMNSTKMSSWNLEQYDSIMNSLQ